MSGGTIPVRGGETKWLVFSVDRLQFLKADGKTVVRSVACPEGVLDVGSLLPGRVRLRIMTAEYATAIREFDVQPGETVDLGEIRLDAGVQILGRVEDKTGQPLAGIKVSVGETWTPENQIVTSDSRGAFLLGRLAPGGVEVEIQPEGFLPFEEDLQVPDGGGTWTVVLERGCVVRGTARTADGKTLAGHVVVLVPTDGASEGEEHQRTDDEGRYGTRLRAGVYRVELRADGESAALASKELTLEAGGSVTLDLVRP